MLKWKNSAPSLLKSRQFSQCLKRARETFSPPTHSWVRVGVGEYATISLNIPKSP